jgi:5-hydroxyisourate hydrolase
MITTHVLDTAAGRPGRAIAVELDRDDAGAWQRIGAGTTDDDGRLRTLTPAGPVAPGTYRLRFHTGAYLAAIHHAGFFPVVEIQFAIDDGAQHYHVPLLLSPYGYSTYRGS